MQFEWWIIERKKITDFTEWYSSKHERFSLSIPICQKSRLARFVSNNFKRYEEKKEKKKKNINNKNLYKL